uniref:Uncharacterized protein n=1 Tax=Lepeophtheirus salmonis TaxID=72036 RepID=A0A0K2TKY3_LEPSM
MERNAYFSFRFNN